MQRRSSVPGASLVAAVALAATLTSCSGGSDTGSGSADDKGAGTASSAAAAEPGKYDSLPEPCGLPERNTLRSLLPAGAARESSAEADKVYGGQPDITFDTDRRVGCHWKRETSEGTRHLSVDLQRIVSYDNSVSDDDKAQEVYDQKEQASDVPSGAPRVTPTPTPSSSGTKGTKGEDEDEKEKGKGGEATGKHPAGGKGAAADPSASPGGRASDNDTGGSASESSDPDDEVSKAPDEGDDDTGASSEAGLEPRLLEDLGDAAFLDDALVTADSGVHRDTTIVFRSSNVIVTIEYDQWSADKTTLPDRRELQEKAQLLAGELAAHWTE